jgi:hypothetical protein
MTNYGGTWIFDPEQSRLETPQPNAVTATIEHDDPRFHLHVLHVHGDRTRTVDLRLTTDGREVASISPEGGETSNRMHWDGNVLVLDGCYLDGGAKTANVVRHTLSADGKQLSADERASGPRYSYHNLWDFRRSLLSGYKSNRLN